MADESPLFPSLFMAGFDASSHRRKDGLRLDLIAGTGHDALAVEDYRACAALGLRGVRDGLRWHLIERSRGTYDWSTWRPMLKAAHAAGVRVVWDLFHYGYPDFLQIGSPEMLDAYGEFAAAATRVHREEVGEPPLFCPFNEISFVAWAVDDGYFPPVGLKGAELKRALVALALAGVAAVRAEESRARFLWAEPLVHVAPRDHSRAERQRAEQYRLAQFEAYDMLMGRTHDDLGGQPDAVDVVGLNFYPHNQWYYHGPTIPMGHHEYRPLADMLVEVAERYGKPMYFAETGAEGSGRPAWLHYVCDETRAAIARGASIEAICLYPVTDYLGWDNARHASVGLFSLPDRKDERSLNRSLMAEIERQRAIGFTLETYAAAL
jgi:beta-glucosidase/6-phospho-beta-glucosidase/beta-galactosidase